MMSTLLFAAENRGGVALASEKTNERSKEKKNKMKLIRYTLVAMCLAPLAIGCGDDGICNLAGCGFPCAQPQSRPTGAALKLEEFHGHLLLGCSRFFTEPSV